jgi:hypothetical protein
MLISFDRCFIRIFCLASVGYIFSSYAVCLSSVNSLVYYYNYLSSELKLSGDGVLYLVYSSPHFLLVGIEFPVTKFLHKFFNKENIPWVQLIWRNYNNSTPQSANISCSFWWRDIVKLYSIFKSIASCLIASGTIFGAISGLQISQ